MQLKKELQLKQDELQKEGLVQWPMIVGGVVPVVNIKGIKQGELKISGEVLASIYLGTIKKWNDTAIVKQNPTLKMPDQDIAVVHRSDGSGTTFLFTSYLTKASKNWADKVGNDASVEWPLGIGGKENEGVANFTAQTPGAIGYVEYAYALQNKLTFTMLANHEGVFITPRRASFQAAAAVADWANAPGFYLILTDQPGKECWPITGASFILMQKLQANPERGKATLNFFSWCFANGATMAEELDYIPIPSTVVKLIKDVWSREIKAQDGQTIYAESP